MTVPHWLPTEIWRLIFQLATAEGLDIYETEYIPFQSSNFFPPRSPTTAISLSRVSKQWQALAAEFLFQRVWVRHGVRGLLESLKGSIQSEGYGRYVRRLELSSTPVNRDAANPIRLVDILACCPYLQIFVQPAFLVCEVGDLEFWSNPIPAEQHQSNDVVLTSLKFLHWSSYGDMEEALEASRSFLSNVILRSPNLCYLSISFPMLVSGSIFKGVGRTGHPVLFPSLKTLAFKRDSGLNDQVIQNSDFPNLTHLKLPPFHLYDISPDGSSILHVVGLQLRTVELHKDRQGGARLDVNPFFKLCSNLQELAYHVGFPPLQPPHLLQHLELKTVRIQIESIDHLREQYGGGLSWAMLDEAFAFFSAYAFPALQLIILHGDWDSVVHDSQFRPLRQLVLDRGCSLEYPNGTPVQ